MKEIDKLVKRVEYKDGVLYWAKGHRFEGKKVGYENSDGYIQIRYKQGNKNVILAHRLIFYMYHGYLPKLIDHIDRNPRNNRIENLREADKSINSINRGLQVNNKTGYKGVYITKTVSGGNRYGARVQRHGVSHWVGTFDTPEEANEARLNFIKKNGYHA